MKKQGKMIDAKHVMMDNIYQIFPQILIKIIFAKNAQKNAQAVIQMEKKLNVPNV